MFAVRLGLVCTGPQLDADHAAQHAASSTLMVKLEMESLNATSAHNCYLYIFLSQRNAQSILDVSRRKD